MYQIIKGTTRGEPVSYSELVGFDSETGEEIYEDFFEFSWHPHEDIIFKNDDYNLTVMEYERILKEFEDNNHWPWNNPHFEGIEKGWKTTYSNNEDSIWFKLIHV